MPERPGRLPGEIEQIDSRLPMTFRMESGRTPPSVGRSEAVFYEDLTVTPDGKGKLYFRRYGRVYVIEANGAFQAVNPPPSGPQGTRLLDDEYLFWASNLTKPFTQRSAGIRWAVAAATPDRFEFDVGTTTRAYMRQVASGNDASLNFSPVEFVLPDATAYTTSPGTSVYRGVDLSGTVVAAAAASGSTSNLISNPGFETWETRSEGPGLRPTTWTEFDEGFPISQNTNVHSGSFSAGLPASDAVTGCRMQSSNHVVGPNNLPTDMSHYIQIQSSNSANYVLSFWLFGIGSAVDKKVLLSVLAFDTQTQRIPSYHLNNVLAWGAGDLPAYSSTYQVVIATDGLFHQVSVPFTFNPGTLGNTYYVTVMFENAGTTISGTNTIVIDDVSLSTANNAITAPLTLRGISEDRLTFQPKATGSDSISLTEITGVMAVPTFKPFGASGASITVTTAYGHRSGFAYDSSALGGATLAVTTAYAQYNEAPSFATTNFAEWNEGTLAVGTGNQLRLYRTSNAFYSAFSAGAQAANLTYTLPLSITANGFLQTDSGGALSWTTLAGGGAVTQVTSDGGLTATPSAGNLNILGGTNGIDTTAGGSTLTINFDPLEPFSSPIPATNGGTGFSSYTVGDLLYADTTTTLAKLADTTAGSWLRAGGAGVAPAWQAAAALTASNDTNVTLTLGGSPTTALLTAASITAGWAGQLSLARGGTNRNNSAVAGAVVYSDSTTFLPSAAGTSGQLLHSGGTGAPTWSAVDLTSSTQVTGALGIVNGGTGQTTALAAFNALSPLTTRGDLLTRDATNNVRLGVGASGTILRSDGTDPAWVSLSTAGIVAGSGTLNFIPKWTPDGNTLGNSIVHETTVIAPRAIVIDGHILPDADITYSDGRFDTAWSAVYGARFGYAGSLVIFTGDAGAPTAERDRVLLTGGVDPATWTFKNIDNVELLSGTTAMKLKFYEPSGSGTNTSSFEAQAQAANIRYILPASQSSGFFRDDGAGTLSWTTINLASSADVGSSVLPIANGGTGQTTALAAFNALSPLTTRGDLLTRDASNNIRLAVGSASTLLKSDGTDPSWGTVNLLSAFHGDTTAGTVTRGDLITGQGATPKWVRLALGSSGKWVRSDGTDVGYSTSTLANTYSRGDIVRASAANVLGGLTVGASGTILRSDGTDPAWSTLASANIVAGSGTNLTIPLWTPDGNTLGNSSLTMSASGTAGRLTHTPTTGTSGSTVAHQITHTIPAGAYTSTPIVYGIRWQPTGTPTSGTPELRGLWFDVGSVGGTWGDFTGVGVTNSGASFNTTNGYLFTSRFEPGGGTHTDFYLYRGTASDPSGGSTTLTNLYSFGHEDEGTGFPITCTSYFGLHIPAVGDITATNYHGFAVALDSNIVRSKYLYWSSATTTALASRDGAIRMNSTTSLDFEVGTTVIMALTSSAVQLVKPITKYNNISTVTNGVPSILAQADLTAQSAAKTATTIYAVPASGAGLYRVSWVASVTRAATTSSVLGGTNGFQVTYTDADDSVVKTSNPTTVTAYTSAGNTTATSVSGSFVANCKASTNLQYAFDYTSVGGTTMQYNLHVRVEAL